ncbi:hypothetical protein LTR86_006489 [Recurvomyces mirabilis]|nr:hypothetical protein LTR86_006489 [Recurvomyces mirabilis]
MARMRRTSSGSFAGEDVLRLGLISGSPSQPVKNVRRSPRKKATANYLENDHQDRLYDTGGLENQIKTILPPPAKSRQIQLAPLGACRGTSLTGPGKFHHTAKRTHEGKSTVFTTKLPAQLDTGLSVAMPAEDMDHDLAHVLDIEVDVEESVWCGSVSSSDDSEDELPSPQKLINFGKINKLSNLDGDASDFTQSFSTLRNGGNRQVDLPPVPRTKESTASRPMSSSDKENDSRAILRFSPPRLYSPRKARDLERPLTPPPTSPTKGRLKSPSKQAARIPTPPFRQSLDAFWDAEAVNDWNEQYSPRKEWSPKKNKLTGNQDSSSPTASPRKTQSPSKRTQTEMANKRDWEARKHRVAEGFLAALDDRITTGKIRELAAGTGGVRFIWSKTLNSTAGRANWRRETIRTRQLDGASLTIHKHHASIELAEKIIDDEERLLNVVAHEFCHLANFMVSGIKDQPHGKQFKEWGRKTTQAFAHRGVEVTTKHSYQIEYKYIWQCSNEDCDSEFKRHSKSVDPKRHTCGACRSKLVQIKPIPRKDAAGNVGGAVTGYAAYVKEHYAGIKAGLPMGATQKEVMEAIGRQYRAEKAKKAALPVLVPTSQLSRSSSTQSLSSVGRGDDKNILESADTSREVNDVARVLEFITIADD